MPYSIIDSGTSVYPGTTQILLNINVNTWLLFYELPLEQYPLNWDFCEMQSAGSYMDLTLGNDGSMDKVEVLLLVLLDQALCNFQAGLRLTGTWHSWTRNLWLSLSLNGTGFIIYCLCFLVINHPSILSLSYLKLPFQPNRYSLACLYVPGFLRHFSVNFFCCFVDFS